MVYLAQSAAAALLEALVHIEASHPGELPRDYQLLEVEGPMTNTDPPNADIHEISSAYFKTMGIQVRDGRDFTDGDVRTSPGVVIINEQLAKQHWPNENPIGKHLTIGSPEEVRLYGQAVSREVVGVIANVKLLDLTEEFSPELYIPNCANAGFAGHTGGSRQSSA